MKCVKSIDELYEEVKEYDLVITVDAALATALNARIDRPMIGSFAITPRDIAGKVSSRVLCTPTLSELKVISTISDETGLSLKYVHSEVENIREIRQYTADVRKHLHTRASKSVYDSYESLPTLDRVMGAFVPDDDEFYKNNSVAVIAEELFNDLDKHFIPLDYTPISIFKEGDYDIDTIYEVGNDRQIAENVADLIPVEKACDYALVLNTTGPLTDAVRAALYRRGIPFINSLNVRDLSQVRDYLQFITLAIGFDTARVKYVKELFSNYNGWFRKGRDQFLLCKQTSDDMNERGYALWNVMKNIREMTFGEVCESICDRRSKIQVGILIDDLDVSDKKITKSLLNEIKYAVDNVKELRHSEQIPENEKKGVLIVDCNNSVYIDRPVVFYLGMDQDWNRPVIGKSYIDAEDETDKNVMRLTALIQQGSVRSYFVNTMKSGKQARPSPLFDIIMKKPTGSFSDICGNIVKGRWHSETTEVVPRCEEMVIESENEFRSPFSKSSFDSYYSCPRQYMYSALLTTPEEKSTEFGTLIHAFAEFYLCYPEDVDAYGLDHFIDMISDRYSGLSSPLLEKLDRDKIRKAMGAVKDYIDLLGAKGAPLDTDLSTKSHPNIFMVAMGKKMTSSACETDLKSVKYPIHGQLDLIWDGIITDYKTGHPSDPKDITRAMTFDPNPKYPEFQAPIYLQLAKERNDTWNSFNLFYAMDNDVERSEGDTDIRANVRNVRLKEGSVKSTIVSSRPLAEKLGAEMSQKLREHVTEILQCIKENGSEDPSEWDKDPALVGEILNVVGLKDNPTNRKTVEAGLRKIAGHCIDGIVYGGSSVEIPGDVLEDTMIKITQFHNEMCIQSEKEFPAAPRIKCDMCKYFSVCTKDVLDIDAGGDSDE